MPLILYLLLCLKVELMVFKFDIRISYQNDFGSINYTFHDVGFQDAICLVFIMAWSREGADRTDLYAYGNDDQLVQIVADNCRRTIVLYEPALVYILFGDYNPGGKLVFTLAKNDSDFGTDISPMGDTNYTEGVFLDYRHFDRYNITPRYHFGYGLSYTTFAFARLDISSSNNNDENSPASIDKKNVV